MAIKSKFLKSPTAVQTRTFSYEQLEDDDLSQDSLVKNRDFIEDARDFLSKRAGETFTSDEDVVSKFLEHMRFHEVNEVTAVRDLMYAQEATEKDKEQFGRLLNTWDRMSGNTDMIDATFDYIEAGITSPSTWLGIVTGGAGKLSSVAAARAASQGARVITNTALKSAGTAALYEGAVGTGTGLAQSEARVETGADEEFDTSRVLMSGVGQAAFGGITGGITGAIQAKEASKILDLEDIGKAATAERRAQGKENTKKVFDGIKDASRVAKTRGEILGSQIVDARNYLKEAEEARSKGLKALNKKKVKQGAKILAEMSQTERTLAKLDDDTVDALTAIAIRLSDKIKLKKDERVTEGIARAISSGKLKDGELSKIIDEFGLTKEQFSLIYLAEFSKAGRTLGMAARVKRAKSISGSTTGVSKQEAEERLRKLLDASSSYLDSASSVITKQEAEFIADQAKKQAESNTFLRSLDRFRLGMMTGQLATTVRNAAGGSFRVAVDVFDKGIESFIKKMSGQQADNPLEVSRYLLFDQQEASLIKKLFEERMPGSADQFFGTFLETATASTMSGGNNLLTQFGAKVNFLNQLSDNMYKKAVFAGRLSQKVKASTGKDLIDVIADGRFNEIDTDIIKEAMTDALDFVYQKTPTGTDVFSQTGKAILNAHHKVPFLVSSIIPFPRFVINQLNFVSQHTPMLGSLVARMQRGKGSAMTPEVLAKQVTGTAMLTVAYNLRASQGLDTEWYEVRTDDNKTMDIRATAGPFNSFLLGADLLYRSNTLGWTEDSPELKNWAGSAKDAFQALGGPSFRAGTGLYTLDRIVEDMSGDEQIGIRGVKTLATFSADMINTFTLPAATFRDLFSLTDEEQRLVPETGYTNGWDIFAARATRSLPSSFFSMSETISKDLGTGAVKLGTPRYDIFTGRALKSVDPLERQIFGFSKREPRNALQNKLIELQMSPYELYRPSQYAVEDRVLRQDAGKELTDRLNSYIKTDEFNSMGKKMQKRALALQASSILSEFREGAKEKILSEQIENLKPGEVPETFRYQFESLPSRERAMLREAYAEEYGPNAKFNVVKALEMLPAVRKRAEGKAQGGLMLSEGGMPGFSRYIQQFGEEEGVLPKKKEDKEESTFPSFEDILKGDPTEGMTEFQKEVYQAGDVTPEKAKEILSVLPSMKNRVMQQSDPVHAEQVKESFDKYEEILRETAFPKSKGLMSRR